MSAEEFSAWDRWSAVPAEQQRQVAKLARRGRRHPDPDVAKAAEAWATVVLDAHSADRDGLGWRVLGALGTLLDPFDLGIDSLDGASERRWARRVLSAR